VVAPYWALPRTPLLQPANRKVTRMTQPTTHGVRFGEAVRVWAQIGLNSFGGPAGQIAVMHRELVERRRWVSENRFLHALNYCMVLPGPEAQQLATYIGWLMHGVRGGVVAGTLFVLPGFVAMLALSAAYAVYGHVGWVAGVFFGIQAAVVAIVAQAVLRIGRRTLRSAVLRVVAALSFVAIFVFAVPFPVIVTVAGAVGLLAGNRRPAWFPRAGHGADSDGASAAALLDDDERVLLATARRALRAAGLCLLLWLTPVAVLLVALGTANVFSQEAFLFSKTAVVTFGGAYAVLGYVAQQAVEHYAWIAPGEMVTGLGLAETTPGPLILVVQFVGFLAAYHHPGGMPPLTAGLLGAVVTTWVTFVPCFLFIFAGAPYVERVRDNAALAHALTAIGAAVAGVVLNLAVWFAVHTAFTEVADHRLGPMHLLLPDLSSVRPASVAVSLLAAVTVFGTRTSTLWVIAASAGVGAAVASVLPGAL
jgi:chromate transporter